MGEQFGVIQEGELVGDRGEIAAALLLADLGLALNRDMGEPAGETVPVPDLVREDFPLLRRHRQHLVYFGEFCIARRFLETHPGHVAGDDSARGFIEMPAGCYARPGAAA